MGGDGPEENLDLLESLRTSTIELVLTRHEQGAGFMAATYGRLTGRAGVCLSTLGPGATNHPPGASRAALATAARMIEGAAHPLLVVASGANRSGTHEAVRSFVDKTGLFFLTTQMGKGVVDERHPRCLGTAALSEDDYVHWAIDHADLIVNVGHDVDEKPPFVMSSDAAKVVHIS